MKFTIVCKSAKNLHALAILNAAHNSGIQASIVDFKDLDDLAAKAPKLGPLVYWRSSSLDIKAERATAGVLLQGKHIVNRAIFDTPYVTHKIFQQRAISRLAKVKSIPTYQFADDKELKQAVQAKLLKYPFIAKPNLGARGMGVKLVSTPADISKLKQIPALVFQNYIKNDGDWRVMVLGGRPLGAIYRRPPKGSYINNIAQGGRAKVETDPKVLKEVLQIATTVASTLNLTFCGIDIIQDKTSGEYMFLESNSAPQWLEGFGPTTGIDVAAEFVNFFSELNQRSQTKLPKLITQYYERSFAHPQVEAKAFHFYSRLYLWSGDTHAYTQLQQRREEYLGKNSRATLAKLRFYLENTANKSQIPQREKYYAKYKDLKAYNRVLFKVLFAQSVYGRDIRPLVKKLKIDGDMRKLFERLWADEHALRVLSTHAVNFYYLLRNYWHDQPEYLEVVSIAPERILDLALGYKRHGPHQLSVENVDKLRIYLLTHAVIGQSLFYQQAVLDPAYLKIVKYLEHLIHRDFFAISLDNKLEFLVCAALCNYDSFLKPIIHNEAEYSLSAHGNYLADKLNSSADRKLVKDRLAQSEHRNVLYLMSVAEFSQRPQNTPTLRSNFNTHLPLIGRKALVDIPGFDLFGLNARVDTGAYFSAIHCSDIRERDGVLHVNLLDPDHPKYNRRPLTFKQFRQVQVKNTTGKYQDRYAVDLEIQYLGQTFKEVFTLADRSQMAFPVLLGRTFLKNRFLIDVSRLIIK